MRLHCRGGRRRLLFPQEIAMKQSVRSHVCVPQRRLNLRHLSRVRRKPPHADLQFHCVIIRKLIRHNARQNHLRFHAAR